MWPNMKRYNARYTNPLYNTWLVRPYFWHLTLTLFIHKKDRIELTTSEVHEVQSSFLDKGQEYIFE